MGMFEHWNRQQKRKFDKLDKDTQAEMLTSGVMEKITPIYNKAVAQSMLSGIKLERKQVYDRFVNKIDSAEKGSDEWNSLVEDMLSYFRVRYLQYNMETKKENVKEN